MKLQIDKLNKLVDDLLFIHQLETKTVKLNYQIFSLNNIITETIGLVQLNTCIHTITFNSENDVTIEADPVLLKTVIYNLINNAVKYSPQGGEIFVNLKSNGKLVEFSVQDFGIGIEKKYLKKIFENYYRVYHDYSQTFPGLGIGLYLTTQIIELHQGKITVKSKFGQGSTFSFSLPHTIT
jgi:signal transduction histidine kinase